MIIDLLYKLLVSKRNLKLPRKKVLKKQDKFLRKMLLHAYNNSSYYKKTFDNAGITEDNIKTISIEKFPTMNKKLLLENFNEIVIDDLDIEDIREFDLKEKSTKKIYKNKYHIVHSSGTTEKPGYFLYDNNDWKTMLVGIVRAALWDMSMKDIIKLLISKPRILYVAATDGRYGGAMAVGDGISGVGAKQLFLDIKMPLEKWEEEIKKFKPNIVIGYPSAIKILAEKINLKEYGINLSRVVSCGEPLNENLRKYFEEKFNCLIINFYGASESLALGVEIGNDDGMYLFDDMNYIEVIDNNMYVTCLYNYSQPLIRYQISDDIELTGYGKEISFTTSTNILGRNEDLMWFENDNKKEFLHPLSIEGFCVEGMLDYQFKKINNQSFEMIIELIDERKMDYVKKTMIKEMSHILKQKDLDNVDFKIRFVEDIKPHPKTGKKKLIVG